MLEKFEITIKNAVISGYRTLSESALRICNRALDRYGEGIDSFQVLGRWRNVDGCDQKRLACIKISVSWKYPRKTLTSDIKSSTLYIPLGGSRIAHKNFKSVLRGEDTEAGMPGLRHMDCLYNDRFKRISTEGPLSFLDDFYNKYIKAD